MIVAESLVKSYGTRTAVDGVSFGVAKGGIFGFLGPNGAGKTTTVRMLIGLTEPTGGRALVAGFDPARDPRAVHSRIGVVFENPNLYERLTVRDNLLLSSRLHGVDPCRVDEVIGRLDLGERSREPISKFSKGMKQRVLIGRALLHKPEVLFLDEPTSGLDPSSSLLIRGLVKELRDEGSTVFLTTHYMEEAEELCDTVAFIESGRIAAMGTPRDLKLRYGDRTIRVVLSTEDGGTETHDWPMEDPDTGGLVSDAIRSGRLLTVHSQEATLADVFIKLTGRDLR